MLPTIVSVITGSIDGAVSAIRISGNKALSIIDAITKVDFLTINPNTVTYTNIGKNVVLDNVLVATFKSPKSYTGEDVVEIYVHASPFIVKEVIQLIINEGAQLAIAGEFTQRAFLNGKLDLAQAEAVADLIAAETKAEHSIALNQLKGGISLELKTLRTEIMNFAALIELELDFAEEDVEFAPREQLNKAILNLILKIEFIAASFYQGNAIKNGVPIAIIGNPNAGKSTLLNTLLNEERAIVTHIAGTTRDTIEEIFTLSNVRFRLIDTAGIRQTTDTVEQLGIQRSLKAAKQASIVFYLYDPAELTLTQLQNNITQLKTETDAPIWIIANKTDKHPAHHISHINISASNNQLANLITQLTAYANTLTAGITNTTISNQRHYQALITAKNQLQKAIQLQATGELLSIHLRDAMQALGSIVGEIDSDEILGAIFTKFCIGK